MHSIFKTICLGVILSVIPYASQAKWHPNYWNAYFDFSTGINYTKWKRLMVSGSANVTVNHLYTGINLFVLQQSAMVLRESSWNLGLHLSDKKRFFVVFGPGIGYITRTSGYSSFENIHTISYPILAKAYYTPSKWLGLHTQVFYSFNSFENYWGATAGVSLGLFRWTNIKYYPK